MENFWKLEEVVDHKQQYTPEEQYCSEYFDKTTTRNEEGRFVVKLPLREYGTSKKLLRNCQNEILSLEKRLQRNEDFKLSYTKCMQYYIVQKHMSKTEINRFIFSAHHGVVKDSSSITKTRVVFDESCKLEDGLPINSLQYVGPTLQDSLFAIIARFRTH